jgi:hypothetical protein
MRQSSSNCSCLLAAMFSLPSAVSNVPDGAEVRFSLAMGTGSRPATSRSEATHPIVVSAASSIETSRTHPSPVRCRRTRAEEIANAAASPPALSQTG